MNFNDIVIEAYYNDGEEIKLRKLNQSKDSGMISKIVRRYSDNATYILFTKYRRGKLSENELINYKLERVLPFFKKLNKQLLQNEEPRKEMFEMCTEEELFCPYGSFKAPFSLSAREYIAKANKEMDKPNIKLFHFAIEKQDKLLGCLVFSAEQKLIGEYVTDGSIDIFANNENASHWRALEPLMCFIHNILGYRDKGKALYFRETTHPLNHNTLPIVSPEHGSGNVSSGLLSAKRGFVLIDTTHEDLFNELRNRYVIKYSRLMDEAAKYFNAIGIKIYSKNEIQEYKWNKHKNDWVKTIY